MTATSAVNELLEDGGVILADGATGTNFFKKGLETGYPPELWNVERPDDVMDLHTSFIDAGSRLILTNSFGGTAHRLKLHDAQDRVEELNLAAAKLARKAADRLPSMKVGAAAPRMGAGAGRVGGGPSSSGRLAIGSSAAPLRPPSPPLSVPVNRSSRSSE